MLPVKKASASQIDKVAHSDWHLVEKELELDVMA
jgi:hypothetical protein|tara:strand:+ start:1787 stop:1888 length:102 start_codon:yes stop_codon:yes gene_type:complete